MKKKTTLIVILLIIISISIAREVRPEDRVRSSNSSQVFHRFTCRYAINLDTTNSEIFDSYELAMEAGLRPCKTCKPEPAPEPPVDPNIVNIDPTIEATNLFPINGVVLQSGYCRRPMEPNDIGTRIIEPTITYTTFDPNNTRGMCWKCTNINLMTGEGNIPQEHLIPVYDPYPADPNDPNVIEYKISPTLPVFKSDQSFTHHIHPDCEHLKSIPVHVVNMRNGLVAGSNAFWNPTKGVIEWRVTKFEAGDYQFVMNSDVGQTSLLAITIRAQEIPDVNDFAQNWLKGNFNMVKYAEWVGNKARWMKYLGRISDATGQPIESGSIEWAFVDGSWKPVTGGANLVSEINADTEITENNTVDRNTTTKEVKIAPFEWRTTEVKVITTDITTFGGYTAYRSSPPNGSTEYLLYRPFGTEVKYVAPTPEQTAVLQAAHYKEIGIEPPPEEVPTPESLDKVMTSADSIRSFTALSKDMRMEFSTSLIDGYMAQKKAYAEYLIIREAWDKDLGIKEQAWQHDQMMHEDDARMEGRHMMMEAEQDENAKIYFADWVARFYASTINNLSAEEKSMLLSMRRRILNEQLELNLLGSEEIDRITEEMDNPVDPNNVE
jgi:hypothetical protein